MDLVVSDVDNGGGNMVADEYLLELNEDDLDDSWVPLVLDDVCFVVPVEREEDASPSDLPSLVMKV